MQVLTQEELVAQLDAFLERHPALAESAIGRAINNEPGLVSSIRGGRSPSLKMANRIAEFIRAKDADAATEAFGAAADDDHAAPDTTGGDAASAGKAGEVSARGAQAAA